MPHIAAPHNCGEDFCINHLFIDAKEASLIDAIYLLFLSTSELKKRQFYDNSEEHRTAWEDFNWRFLMFLSLLAQKIILLLKNPIKRVGSTLEMSLNYISCNGGLFGILSNYFKGKVVEPKESSLISFVGELDRRMDLDKSIRIGDSRYNSMISMMAAKLSYETEHVAKDVISNKWQMEFLRFYDCWNDYLKQKTTQAIMFQNRSTNQNLIVVAFRGTSPFAADDWITDFDLSYNEIKGIGRIHSGFMKALGLQKTSGWPKNVGEGSGKIFAYYKIREDLKNLLRENENAKFILTGHSLGGALAILFVGVLGLHGETWMLERLEGVYTYGQPRVGDEKFGHYMTKLLEEHDVKYFRYVYCNDLVPRVPYDDDVLLYKHFGKCLYYNSFYKGQVLDEEPNKNLLSLVEMIPIRLNALWELIRSFILPYWKGAQYKEGWLTTMARVTGLIFPGFSAHCPDNYVNITRIGELCI